MATPPVPPPPISNALGDSSGLPHEAWARWFQLLWTKQKEVVGGGGSSDGASLASLSSAVAGLTSTVSGHTTTLAADGTELANHETRIGTLEARTDTWSEASGTTDTLEPTSGANTKAQLVSTDPDSRDHPSGCIIFRNTGLTNNPMIAIGNPYIAGVGLVAYGAWYSDDTMVSGGIRSWAQFFSNERSGTLAPVLDRVQRSAIEVFAHQGGFKPLIRAYEASSQMMQVGAWGLLVAPGGAVRSGGVLTLTSVTITHPQTGSPYQAPHRLGAGQKLYKGVIPGNPGNTADLGNAGDLWGPGGTAMTVATVVDPYTVTVADSRANYTNTDWLSFTVEPADDTCWGRDSYGVFIVYTKSGVRLYVTETGIVMPAGLSVLGATAGTELPIGAGGVAALGVSDTTVHVQNGKDFYQEGTYRSTGWFNGGGQTQTTQEVFIVGTGGGSQTTYLRQISGKDWMRLMVVNDGQGGTNTLTVTPYSGDTIKGGSSLVLPAYAGATLVSQGTNWQAFYHPPPP